MNSFLNTMTFQSINQAVFNDVHFGSISPKSEVFLIEMGCSTLSGVPADLQTDAVVQVQSTAFSCLHWDT
jgi:hypothetical protein